jgi:Fur family ferric uptake transcriptional regulator
VNSKHEKYCEILKKNGYKLTNQRKVVLDMMIEHQDEHVTVEELYQYIKVNNPEIGLATVYRNIQLLCDMDIVDKISLDDENIRYELSLDDCSHKHHHLICTKCGAVIEVKEDLMGTIEENFLNTYGFRVEDHQAKFYGVCEKCQD